MIYVDCQWVNLDRKKGRLLQCTNGLYLQPDDKGRYNPDLVCDRHDEYRRDTTRIGEDPYERDCFDLMIEVQGALVALSVAIREAIMLEHGWLDLDLFAATYAARAVELTEMFRMRERNRQRFISYNSLLGRVDDHLASLRKIISRRSRLTGAHVRARRDLQAVRRLQETLIEKGP